MNAVSFDLTGRVALVTGASSGLGRHFAGVLARAGAAVAVAARRVESLAEVAVEIAESGGNATVIRLDVTDARSVHEAVAAAVAQLGGLDILVNNAGTTVTRTMLDLSEAEWDAVLDVNLKGCFLVAQAAARAMVQAGRGGAIVNIASILGLRASAQLAPYIASKAGLVRLSQAMALEFARYNIRVNALCPGYIETDINHAFFATQHGEALVKRIPQRRLGRMTELDGPLLLLCSDAGSYITGATLAVDGGHLVNTL
jgi:NAD(P)-dependent dehydrogenase (short-subunit alcohol dehydrogenase family)